jgi:hypothetical protein
MLKDNPGEGQGPGTNTLYSNWLSGPQQITSPPWNQRKYFLSFSLAPNFLYNRCRVHSTFGNQRNQPWHWCRLWLKQNLWSAVLILGVHLNLLDIQVPSPGPADSDLIALKWPPPVVYITSSQVILVDSEIWELRGLLVLKSPGKMIFGRDWKKKKQLLKTYSIDLISSSQQFLVQKQRKSFFRRKNWNKPIKNHSWSHKLISFIESCPAK